MQPDRESSSRLGWLVGLPALVALLPFLPMLWRSEIPVLRDHADYFVPLRWFTARSLRAGVIPHWNPLNGLGEPWLANPQTGILYPPSLLFLAGPFEMAYVLWIVLHLALMGGGVAVLCARFVSLPAALVVGVASMFVGPVLSMIDVSNNLATLAWIPWVAVASLREGTDGGRGLAVGSLLALAFLAGEPSFAAIAVVLFVFITISVRSMRGAAIRVAVAGVTAVCIAAPQLLPFVALLRGSDRAKGLDSAEAFANSLSVHDLAALLTPQVESGQQFVVSLLVGPALAILIALGAVTAIRRRARTQCVLLGVAFVLLILAFAGSLGAGTALLSGAGLSVVRHPSRFVVPALVLLMPLAAVGLDIVLPRLRRAGWASVVVLLAAATAALVEAPAAAAMYLALQAAVVALFIVARGRRPPLLFAGAVLACTLLAQGTFAFRSAPFRSLIAAPPGMVPGTRVAVQSEPQTRRDGAPRAPLTGYSNLLVGVAKADSPAPVVASGVLRFFEQGVEAGSRVVLSSASVSRLYGSRASGLEPAAEAGWWIVDPVPLVSGWTGAVTSPDDAAALEAFLDGGSAVIHSTIPLRQPDRIERAPMRAAIEPLGNGWRIRSESERGLVLVISETAAKGWNVRVDDTSTSWFTVNGLFRAVLVPAGRHTITWQYVTPGWREGWSLLLAFVLIAVTEAARRWRQARRARIHDSMRPAT